MQWKPIPSFFAEERFVMLSVMMSEINIPALTMEHKIILNIRY